MQKTKEQIKLSVVLPAYNEGLHIFENLLKVCNAVKQYNYEVIVVDDGSSDNTFSESKRASKVHKNIKPIHVKENQGKGASLFYGFQESNGELIGFLDADLEISPDHLVKLL